jgi:receptor-binding and translocation channel-forming TcA subunit of Tc toxin
LMRGYIEIAARAAWQAERALAYEQIRDIRIIKMNYFPHALRGVTGPDQLQADLTGLEATRLQGVRLTTPVKHTISLAREMPLAFAALKETGTCRFRTDEGVLRLAYPGTYGYRIRAVTVAAHDPEGPPPRGILCNQGVSLVSSDDAGVLRMLVRFPDALALSEFRLRDDLFVYGLPGETLLQFEGSGFTTEWRLDFLPSANPRGLRSLADVLFTMDMNAFYSESLAAATAARPPAPGNRAVAFAASVWDPKGFKSLRGPGASAAMTFDPTRLALPAQEKARTLANLAVICVGSTSKNYTAKLKASKAGKQSSFTIEDGMALSNAEPLKGLAAALPLNSLVGVSLDQPFVLTIDKSAAVAAELSKLFDVVLYLEYTATI